MASFNFTVDTEPMARTLDGVAHRVDGVTTAVVTMQTAVVLAEKKASDNISHNVNKGFYTLIRSQISQKLARLKSEVESKLMEMSQQSAALISIKNQMEKDYQMIAVRYTKLFNSLNKSLKTRVFDLDRPVTNFVSNQVESTANRLRIFLGKVPVQQSECVNTTQVITSSRTKYNAFRAINAIKDFIADSRTQKVLISQMLDDAEAYEPKGKCLPFIVCESVGLTLQQPQWSNFAPVNGGGSFNNVLNKTLQARVFANNTALGWADYDKNEAEKVSAAFKAIAENAQVTNRVKTQALAMFENNHWQTLKASSL